MYRRKEVEQITGIPARRIQFYSDSGLLHLVEASPGRGRERKYSRDNVLEFLIIKELSKYRIELSEIKRIMIELPGELWPDFFSLDSVCKPHSARFITIFDDQRVSYGSVNRQYGTVFKKVDGSLDEDYSSVLVINVSKLADQIRDL